MLTELRRLLPGFSTSIETLDQTDGDKSQADVSDGRNTWNHTLSDFFESVGLGSVYGELAPLLRDPRQFITEFVNLGVMVVTALVCWKMLMFVMGCGHPVVVVLSGSMEPAMKRGDVLLLSAPTKLNVGDVVVYENGDEAIPIVHRIIQKHLFPDGEFRFLTKGDHNKVNDRALYADRAHWITQSSLLGKAIAIVPYAGLPTILFNDYPFLKFGLLLILGVLQLTGHDI